MYVYVHHSQVFRVLKTLYAESNQLQHINLSDKTHTKIVKQWYVTKPVNAFHTDTLNILVNTKVPYLEMGGSNGFVFRNWRFQRFPI